MLCLLGRRVCVKRGVGTVFQPPLSFEECCGGVLLSHTLPGAVPSALAGLASRFGMEAGGGYDHHKWFNQYSHIPLVWGFVLVVIRIVATSTLM